MNFALPPIIMFLAQSEDCPDAIERLIGNLSGFVYRRRNDTRWTMDFVSAGCRDLIGYDPHRFVGNASIAFGDLIAPSDWEDVNQRVRHAVSRRKRAVVEYMVRTAHGAWVRVEDRFTPVVNGAGDVLAIEGVIDRARHDPAPIWSAPRPGAFLHPIPLHPHSLN